MLMDENGIVEEIIIINGDIKSIWWVTQTLKHIWVEDYFLGNLIVLTNVYDYSSVAEVYGRRRKHKIKPKTTAKDLHNKRIDKAHVIILRAKYISWFNILLYLLVKSSWQFSVAKQV